MEKREGGGKEEGEKGREKHGMTTLDFAQLHSSHMVVK